MHRCACADFHHPDDNHPLFVATACHMPNEPIERMSTNDPDPASPAVDPTAEGARAHGVILIEESGEGPGVRQGKGTVPDVTAAHLEAKSYPNRQLISDSGWSCAARSAARAWRSGCRPRAVLGSVRCDRPQHWSAPRA